MIRAPEVALSHATCQLLYPAPGIAPAFDLQTAKVKTGASELRVDEFNAGNFKEGGFVDPYVGAVGLLKQAPHPNATKVAINWLLSWEGQIAFQSALKDIGNYHESMREDISKEIIPPADRRAKEQKYLFASRADWMDMTPVLNHVTKALQEGEKEITR